MLRRMVSGLLAALLIAVLVVPSPAAERPREAAEKRAASQQISAVEGMLSRVMEAMGGEKAIEGIRNMVIDLEVSIQGPQGNMGMSITRYQVLPDKIRQEISFPTGRMVQVFDGQNGWMEGPQGVMDLPPQQVNQLKEEISRNNLNLLKSWREGKVDVEALPSEEFQGKEALTLLLQFPSDSLGGMDSVKAYVDPTSYRIIGQSYSGGSPMGRGEIVVTFSDFRKVKGVIFPFQGRTTFEGKEISKYKITNLEVNTEIDPSLFQR